MVKIAASKIKIERARELIQKHSFVKTKEILKEEYGSALGNTLLKQLRDEIPKETGITPEIKESIKVLFDLMGMALGIKAFKKLCFQREFDALDILEGLLDEDV